MEDKWNMTEICCETCMYYAPKTGSVGRCRRHAPTASGYPVVYARFDWCGDHKVGTNPHKEAAKPIYTVNTGVSRDG